MNDQNQNNPKPDYGFILNQQAPTPKPKHSKKVLVLIGLGGVLIVALIGSYVLTSSLNKVSNQTQTNQAAAATHLRNIASGDTAAAYSELSTNTQTNYTQEAYKSEVLKTLTDKIDIGTCSEDTAKHTATTVYFACSSSDKKFKVTLKLVTTEENSQTRIQRYEVVGAEKVS